MINSLNIGTPEPAVEPFFGNESAEEMSNEIIGLSANMLTSSVYMNIRNKGLFAYSLRGKLRWSIVPVLNQSGYRQGCRESVSDCYFTSTPVIDHCEASIYVSFRFCNVSFHLLSYFMIYGSKSWFRFLSYDVNM